ncbi:hypothetical protein QRX60_31870 [Amycolatopsis mongoliensis]|uniref:Uncharacterized protein n=1 Tax=Amycolatopsis mongoliensis TaxID=715475 RepID=A0A9Y2JHM7_9PSEU|nr:hypothetical protein [Amycolatopsis sp. 4-36]WIX98647.1 hypothetical protein QRX60_31870 [Amycolatopsis sp. 4-36]
MNAWAAVLGFIGAVLGSWGAQLIATRREDRRWEREREREDLRWRREHDREERRLRQVEAQRLREQRVANYGDLLTLFQKWDHALGVKAKEMLRPGPVGEFNGSPIMELERDGQALLGTLQTHGSDDIIQAGVEAYFEFCDTNSTLALLHSERPKDMRLKVETSIESSAGAMSTLILRTRAEIEKLMKVDD